MSPSTPNVNTSLPPILSAASQIVGFLSSREIRFLSVLVTHPTANGHVVEIGSYHGKSTVVLAMAAGADSGEKIIAVDPIEATPLRENLERFGVADKVEFLNITSTEFWSNWDKPIRLLWNDGANDRETVAGDIESALPSLDDGAIVAFHDVLNTSGERIHVYVDEVLGSPHFGASGVVGSIGWSQYREHPKDAIQFRPDKARLRGKLERLRPFADLSSPQPVRIARCRYKLLRSLVPHDSKQIDKFMRQAYFQDQQGAKHPL